MQSVTKMMDFPDAGKTTYLNNLEKKREQQKQTIPHLFSENI